MSHTICFITNELYPITKGGCGTLITNSIFELLKDNYKVIVLADIENTRLEHFKKIMKNVFYNENMLRLVSLRDLIQRQRSILTTSLENSINQSYLFYKGLLLLMEQEHIDIIEFPDYFGWAYFTLSHFISHNNEKHPKLYVRFHLSMELIDHFSNWGDFGINRFILHQMERYCFSFSDNVLMPNESFAKWAHNWYGQSFSYAISPPSLSALKIMPRKINKTRDKILFYARLAPQKGVELMVDAALKLINEGLDQNIKFTFAGPDMNQAPGGGSIIQYLKRQIPQNAHNRIEFIGNVTHEQFNDLIPNVLLSVVPTRLETFCYAAREMIMAGIPTIVSNIPAFQDLINDKKCLSCELNSTDIAKKINRLITNNELIENLSTSLETRNPLGKVYEQNKSNSEPNKSSKLMSNEKHLYTIILLANENITTDVIEYSYQSMGISDKKNVWVAKASVDGPINIMGRRVKLFSLRDYTPIVGSIGEFICFINAGDKIEKDYFPWAFDFLSEHPDFGFIGAKTESHPSSKSDFDHFPWDAAPEALPFLYPGYFCSCLIRGNNTTFEERLDPRLLFFQEIDSIWERINHGEKGIRSPGFVIKKSIDSRRWAIMDKASYNSSLHLLLNRHLNKSSRLRLAEVLKALVHESNLPLQDLYSCIRSGGIPEIGTTRLNLSNLLKLTMARIGFLTSSKIKFINIFREFIST